MPCIVLYGKCQSCFCVEAPLSPRRKRIQMLSPNPSSRVCVTLAEPRPNQKLSFEARRFLPSMTFRRTFKRWPSSQTMSLDWTIQSSLVPLIFGSCPSSIPSASSQPPLMASRRFWRAFLGRGTWLFFSIRVGTVSGRARATASTTYRVFP